jgi:ATP-dependent DNA helicase RecQ
MTNPLLAQLAITPADLYHLPARLRNQVLTFLQRWEAWDELLECLAHLDTSELVSLQDMQARALEGLGRQREALSVMQQRLAQSEAKTAWAQLVRIYLGLGDTEEALALAQQLTTASPTTGAHWGLLGQVYLTRNDLPAAEEAFRHHQALAPSSRQVMVGMMNVHHRRGDLVTAAAYAVRAYTVEAGDEPLPIYLLHELARFFAETSDANRQRAAEERLTQRQLEEVAQLQALVTAAVGDRRQVHRVRSTLPPEANAPVRREVLLPDLSAIPVSTTEREGLTAAAQQHFGFAALLPAQAEIMACSRRGEDVLAILPTGAGKSLCYQLPAVLDAGITLVVSPLIALMKDQIDNLPTAMRSQAIAINSTLDGAAMRQAVDAIANGKYRLIYVAPERLRQPSFLAAVRQAGLARLVVDEAHCVSAWGHDFRPDYLHLARAHRDLGSPPLLAVTATAPPRVRQDIERQLLRRDTTGAERTMRLVATDIFRPNLRLHAIKARNEDERLQQLLNLCHALTGSGIIYARTRQRCEELAALLRRQGVEADHYHAGIEQRDAAQERFMRGEIRVVVATIAFGMGIDKPDIRFIIHYGLPDAVESYYQEIGRAGRDGQPAHCILLHTTGDKAMLTQHARADALETAFLRQVYRAVRMRLAGQPVGTVALDDLVRDLRSDEVTVRVAVSVLEQAGHLARDYDAPRTVTLRLLKPSADAHFAAFIDRAHLPPHQNVTRRLLDWVAAAQLPVEQLEPQLLTWQQAGWLDYDASGRDLLIRLTTPPAGTPSVDSLLDQFATIQQQRVTEIVDYARTKYCRHGYLADYLGGAARQECGVCDNCGASLPAVTVAGLPDEDEQRHIVLAALDKHGWGRRTLIALLRGEPDVAARAGRISSFGQLAFRSESALDKLIGSLLTAGAVAETPLPHGGMALGLTALGRQMLHGQTHEDPASDGKVMASRS